MIRTRSDGDVVTYPDDDRILKWQDRGEDRRRSWTDLAGNPAGNPHEIG